MMKFSQQQKADIKNHAKAMRVQHMIQEGNRKLLEAMKKPMHHEAQLCSECVVDDKKQFKQMLKEEHKKVKMMHDDMPLPDVRRQLRQYSKMLKMYSRSIPHMKEETPPSSSAISSNNVRIVTPVFGGTSHDILNKEIDGIDGYGYATFDTAYKY